MIPSRSYRVVFPALVVLVVVALAPVSAQAQTSGAPDSFSVNLAATGMLIEVSAPAVLPLDLLAGLSYAQVGVNSQPRIQSTAAPMYVPIAQDTGLLGGTSGVLAVVIRLAPGLVVGAPSLFGLEPLPADPSAIPVSPLADMVAGLPLPGAPPLGCSANLPDQPREAECGGGAQEFFGYRVGAGSARTTASGDENDPSTLASRSDASVLSVGPASSVGVLPMRIGSLAATAEARIEQGRVVAAGSAAVGEVDIAGQFSLGSVSAQFAGALGGTQETFAQQLQCDIVGAEFGGEKLELGTESITFGGDGSALPIGDVLGAVDDLTSGLGGDVGPADLGTVTITPNPAPVSEVSPDGTSVQHRFGCLEVRYRIPRSGTDVRITLGNIAATVNAANDVPFAAELPHDGSSDDFGSGESGISVDGQGPLDTGSAGPATGNDFALPEAPVAGEGAPAPTDAPFLRSSAAAGWGIDGGWFAPFTLLALSIPLLVKSRRFTAGPGRR